MSMAYFSLQQLAYFLLLPQPINSLLANEGRSYVVVDYTTEETRLVVYVPTAIHV